MKSLTVSGTKTHCAFLNPKIQYADHNIRFNAKPSVTRSVVQGSTHCVYDWAM